jgi:DNA invertase Pin-like site-specific DNA recombinase
MNVLKPDLQTTIKTLLGKGMGQREIQRKTGIDRKTIRRYAQSYNLMASQEAEHSKSPTEQCVSTGIGSPSVQNPPPRPPPMGSDQTK